MLSLRLGGSEILCVRCDGRGFHRDYDFEHLIEHEGGCALCDTLGVLVLPVERWRAEDMDGHERRAFADVFVAPPEIEAAA